MKVRELMTQHAECCEPGMTLAAATERMWRIDCGVLPVVEGGKLAGILTDRDICIALGTRDRRASEVLVREVAMGHVEVCHPNDDIRTAMEAMRRAEVHRLPVVNDANEVEGILSVNDIVLAVDRGYDAIDSEEVMETVKAVCQHRGRALATMETLDYCSCAVGVT